MQRCGGFNRAGVLRPADCASAIDYAQSAAGPEPLLFVLRDTPAPPPPAAPVQFPPRCSLFAQRGACHPAVKALTHHPIDLLSGSLSNTY
jgi:hypothetical protein